MLQVALVPPYGEVDNADGEATRYATRGHIEEGGKTTTLRHNFYSESPEKRCFEATFL